MLISTALLLDSIIRNSVCTPAKLACRRVEVRYEKVSKTNIRKNCNFIEAASFQLYVAASGVRSFNDLKFYISEYNGQGHLANDEILS
jgi:hypothetical protein